MNTEKMPVLALVIPCFNEEHALPISGKAFASLLEKLKNSNIVSEKSYCLFIDDGSADETWNILSSFHISNPNSLKAIRLSRNFGHQNALLAGLEFARDNCDCAISLDADLQHDISLVEKMIFQYASGSEIVLAIKNNRGDSWFKSQTAWVFYKLSHFFGLKIIRNHSDFRLLGKKALNALLSHKENNLFIRGLMADLGFKQSYLYFDVLPRAAGKSKYSLYKMSSLALNGITSFSVAPLRMVTFVGFLVLLASFAISIYIMYQYMNGHTVPGWTSTVLPIYFLGGIQMLSLGIIGEYLGKALIEIKNRPKYIIDETKA